MLDAQYVMTNSEYSSDGLFRSNTNRNRVIHSFIGAFKLIHFKPKEDLPKNNIVKDMKILRRYNNPNYDAYLIYDKVGDYYDKKYVKTAYIAYITAFEKLGFIPPIELFHGLCAYGKFPKKIIPLMKAAIIVYRRFHLNYTKHLLNSAKIENDLSLSLSESALIGDIAAEAVLHDLEEENA